MSDADDPAGEAGTAPRPTGSQPLPKLKSQPTAFFDILAENDVQRRAKKIAEATQASLNLDDLQVSRSSHPPDVILDPSCNLVDDLPNFLQLLAGDVFVDKRNVRKLKRLGEGGFGIVHKAELRNGDTNHPRIVAIKALKPGVIEDDEDLKELIQEANLLRKVQHKSIVEFCGIGSTHSATVTAMRESVFFAEEYMAGGTLKHLIVAQMKRPLPRKYHMRDALRWCIQVAEALQYLHNCHPVVVHRDMKPENVLLTTADISEAEAKIADFGLHKRLNKVANRLHQPTFILRSLSNKQSMRMIAEDRPDSQGDGSSIRKALSGVRDAVLKQSTKKNTLLSSEDEEQNEPHAVAAEQDGRREGKRRMRKTKSKPKRKGKNLGNIGSMADSTVSGCVGSLMYMAPEVVRGSKYDEKVDVFSFGLIVYELFNMELTIIRLLSNCSTPHAMESKLHTYSENVSKGFREHIPAHWPQKLRELIRECWSQDPAGRPRMGQVLDMLVEIQESGVIESLDHRIDRDLRARSPGCCPCVIS